MQLPYLFCFFTGLGLKVVKTGIFQNSRNRKWLTPLIILHFSLCAEWPRRLRFGVLVNEGIASDITTPSPFWGQHNFWPFGQLYHDNFIICTKSIHVLNLGKRGMPYQTSEDFWLGMRFAPSPKQNWSSQRKTKRNQLRLLFQKKQVVEEYFLSLASRWQWIYLSWVLYSPEFPGPFASCLTE